MADETALGFMTYVHFETEDDTAVRLVDSDQMDGGCRLFVGPGGVALNVSGVQHLLGGLAEWLHEHHPDAGPEAQLWEILRPDDEAEESRG